MVEAALCLPLILIIVSATMELTTTIYLKESLTIAAFEGCRVAVARNGNDEAVRARVDEFLEERGIELGAFTIESAVEIIPSSETAVMMEPIEIRVKAPTVGNTVSPFGFMRFITPPEMSATVVMRKEFTLETIEEEPSGG